MDKLELRRVLFKKPKKELLEFIGTVTEKCPHFRVPSDMERLRPEIIASRLLSILLNMRLDYPEEESLCIELLSNEDIEEKFQEGALIKEELSKATKYIPFNPNEICKYFFQLIKNDEDFMKNWNEKRLFSGFVSLLSINGIGLPTDMEELLFQKVFNSPQLLNIDYDLTIKYARFQLDNWEKELKLVISELRIEGLEEIFSLNLIFQGIISILEKLNVKIRYNYDDIPLLKRVILAQYLKLLKEGVCKDEDLDEFAERINNIIDNKITESNIKLLPWSDFE